MDIDLQDPPDLIEPFVERWREGYDIVYGIRAARTSDTAAKRLSAGWFYWAFNSMSPVRIPANVGDFRLVDRRAVEVLRQLPERNRFMKGLFAWVGFKQIGVPYVRPRRPHGESTNSFLRNLGWARRAIVSFSYGPLDLITWLALATVGLTMLAIIVQVSLRIAAPDLVPRGLTTIILVVLFVSGIQLLCLAIIGEIGTAGALLRDRMRDLVRNNPHAAKAVSVLVNNIIGSGIIARAASGNDKLDAQATALWEAWSARCDADGQLDFLGIQTLACRQMVEAGEVLIRRRPRRASDGLDVPLQLQLLEADMLDAGRNGDLVDGGRIVQGVEFNGLGQQIGRAHV